MTQGVFDRGDRWVDGLARVLKVPADADATAPHLLGPSNPQFGRVCDIAAEWAWAAAYHIRGTTGSVGGDEVNGPDGQMSQQRRRAEKELREILGSLADAVVTGDRPGEFAAVEMRFGRPCGPFDEFGSM